MNQLQILFLFEFMLLLILSIVLNYCDNLQFIYFIIGYIISLVLSIIYKILLLIGINNLLIVIADIYEYILIEFYYLNFN